MAYAAVTSLAQTTHQILNDHDPYHRNSSLPAKETIKSIYDHTLFLQGFLEDFPKKANSLEGEIRDVAYQVEDLIDCWSTSGVRRGYGEETQDLEKAREKIVSVAEQVKIIKNSFRIEDEQQFCDSPAASSSKLLPTNKGDMIGFEEELLAIKSQLYGGPSQLQVIPIYGMGGIGKTTLARNVYDDPLIMRHFDIRAWVTISQHYSAQEILLKLLVSMKKFNAEGATECNDVKVYQILKGRRYLIVLDDVWSTEAWDDVRNTFPDDNNGSRIMLTTRLLEVAAYPILCSSINEMQFMNQDQSWNLLRHKVFAHQHCPPELEYIGKEIARSCRGLPLAIVVIAGILSTVSKNQASWAEIAENVNSVVAGKGSHFEEILSLSYTHLPHHLRPCFLYMGAFPEDHEIRVSKLIKLWVAEAFLKCPNGSKSFEEEAEECLENLVKRSLVLVIERKMNGKIKSCRLHDLMRDLCIRKANEEKFLANIREGYDENELSNQRRISVAFLGPLNILRNCGSAIHTIIWFIYTSLPSLESCSLLRVLDAGDAYDVKPILAQLFELFHLRYLALNCPGEIPAGISDLQNLQTLIIRARGRWKLDADHEDCLPLEIWAMPRLRHLVFYGTLPDPGMIHFRGLANLQTLCFSLSENNPMKMIHLLTPNLKKLKINHYGRPGGLLQDLLFLRKLENFELCSHSVSTVWQKDDFNLPCKLKKLTLNGLRLPWNAIQAAVGSLSRLQVLKLKDHACSGGTWVTTAGVFPQLQLLLIEECYIECWTTESSHFPRLKFLLIHDCCRLNKIPDGIGEIPTLELIEVKGHVRTSLVKSANEIQEQQQDLGNYDLQVRCIGR